MPDRIMIEEPLTFGESGRLFGILTRPNASNLDSRGLPLFLFLNAGLLHRVGPYRLHVSLARNLSQLGFSSLRIDLSGKGDSARRADLSNSQSVAADYDQIMDLMVSRLGRFRIVLVGLCSGADDAIRLAIRDERIIGMLLLDPYCFKDEVFSLREVIMKYTNPARYLLWLRRRLNLLTTIEGEGQTGSPVNDVLALRDLPSKEQMRVSFRAVGERQGRVLSIFTQYALSYYNQKGQLGRVLDVAGYNIFCEELFWPDAGHTYSLEFHRRQLMDQVNTWASGFEAVGASQETVLQGARSSEIVWSTGAVVHAAAVCHKS